MKTNRYNEKVVQREEWTKPDTVVITYTDGRKETMSRKSFNQIIREVKSWNSATSVWLIWVIMK